MSSRFDLIAQQLIQKDFEQCTVEELQHYAEVHPYLAAAQFLLIKKLQLKQDPSFRIKAQKAALYYHQPVAFEAFLFADETSAGFNRPAPPDPEPEVTDFSENAVDIDEGTNKETAVETAPELVPPVPPLQDAPVADGLTFEPYHMVDYFASQGIKLSQEEVPKDKFGKQLMSFTAWLKTMKKLPSVEQAKNMDPQAEQNVEHLAAHSVSGAEVVTETMAEIWAKQGQPAKAAEVYQKLSLLHPSKKAYFAAKLQNLKH